jgi:3'-5' exoribonuclease
LHDCGKVRELCFRRSFAYTDEGQLLGHLSIGVEMVTEKVRHAEALTGEPFPRELLLRVKHMILSHHGQLDFGSPVVPMTPEAILLCSLDNLDAKVHTFTRDIRDDRNPTTSWTQYSQSLGRRLFKGSTNGNETAPSEE